MPFIEVLDFDPGRSRRKRAAIEVTKAVCRGFDVEPDIVTIYFHTVGMDGYSHDGKFGIQAARRRIFVKVHAFERTREKRAFVAESITDAIATAYGTDRGDVSIYFFPRQVDEASHGGALGSDSENALPAGV